MMVRRMASADPQTLDALRALRFPNLKRRFPQRIEGLDCCSLSLRVTPKSLPLEGSCVFCFLRLF